MAYNNNFNGKNMITFKFQISHLFVTVIGTETVFLDFFFFFFNKLRIQKLARLYEGQF